MKNILILTNEPHLAECLTISFRMRNHKTLWARTGAVGYAILRRWKPDLIVCAELDDCHAGSVAHTITMRAKQKPLMVAVHRRFDTPKQDSQYETRCLEMGYDIAVTLPIRDETIVMWLKRAGVREIEEWPGKLLLSSPPSSSGGSCGLSGS